MLMAVSGVWSESLVFKSLLGFYGGLKEVQVIPNS